MTESKWRNQYVDLVETKELYIIAGANSGLSEAQIASLAKRRKNFDRLIVEPCSGSGTHLIAQAEKNPNALCVGFELRFKRTFRTAEKAEKKDLKNLIVIRSNARIMSELFEANSIDELYVNFPDPWVRKRWLKHRILNSETIPVFASLLKPNGFLAYKTDHEEYFYEAVAEIEKQDCLLVKEKTSDLYKSDFLESNIQTEFEQLFLSKGMKIFHAKAFRHTV